MTCWLLTLRSWKRWTHQKICSKRLNAKEVIFSKGNGKFNLPIADGRFKLPGGDQALRTPTLARPRPIQRENNKNFLLGESEGSLPQPHDSLLKHIDGTDKLGCYARKLHQWIRIFFFFFLTRNVRKGSVSLCKPCQQHLHLQRQLPWHAASLCHGLGRTKRIVKEGLSSRSDDNGVQRTARGFANRIERPAPMEWPPTNGVPLPLSSEATCTNASEPTGVPKILIPSTFHTSGPRSPLLGRQIPTLFHTRLLPAWRRMPAPSKSFMLKRLNTVRTLAWEHTT